MSALKCYVPGMTTNAMSGCNDERRNEHKNQVMAENEKKGYQFFRFGRRTVFSETTSDAASKSPNLEPVCDLPLRDHPWFEPPARDDPACDPAVRETYWGGGTSVLGDTGSGNLIASNAVSARILSTSRLKFWI